MKIHLLSGFLGSGKTTAIQHACYHLLQQHIKAGVITNDQGIKLVDGNFFESLGIPNRQVVNGCFCCNYNDLDTSIQSLIENNNPDIIFAESVGSCTDIVATVLKPLQHLRKEVQVTISTFADVRLLQMILAEGDQLFDETVRYIYHKQLEEASIIVVNKIDLINAAELAGIKQLMQEKYGTKTLLYLSATDNDGIQQWLQTLDNTSLTSPSSLQIDYDMYGAGEAKLAWLDEELTIHSPDNKAIQTAFSLTKSIYQKIQTKQYAIGHLKFLIDEHTKLSYTATSKPELTNIGADLSPTATLLINARVQTTPEELNSMVQDAIMEMESATGNRITVSSISAFQPGYPYPTYRMAEL
jgi:G3E family GTPase